MSLFSEMEYSPYFTFRFANIEQGKTICSSSDNLQSEGHSEFSSFMNCYLKYEILSALNCIYSLAATHWL